MKRKGFTLIELLAVIVVLSVIALIATPTILGVIENSRKVAYKDSIYGIIEAANIYLATNINIVSKKDEIIFTCNGISCSNEEGDKLSFKGNVPKSGSFYVKRNGTVTVESVYNGRYYANTVDDDIEITDTDTTLTRAELTTLVKQLQSETIMLQQELNELQQQDNSIINEINNIKNNSAAIDDVYPVGSIYISTNNINPSNLFKGTTWEIYGENRMLMGVGIDFESGQTGGSSTVTLTENNLPNHTHNVTAKGTIVSNLTNGLAKSNGLHNHTIPSLSGTTNTTGNHNHTGLYEASIGFEYKSDDGRIVAATTNGYRYGITSNGSTSLYVGYNGNHSHIVTTNQSTSGSSGSHTHTVTGTISSIFTGSAVTTSATGSNKSFSVQNPYITVYVWKRVS